MPIVLRDRVTGEIACGMLKNSYQFVYYGAIWWDNKETAAESAKHAPGAEGSGSGPDGWEPLEVSEERLKLFNVKLNNDPRRRLYMDENGLLTVRKEEREGEGERR